MSVIWSLGPNHVPGPDHINELVDDPNWCGHAMVDRRFWTCFTCARHVTQQTRERLSRALAPTDVDHVWVLTETYQDPDEDPDGAPFPAPPLVHLVTRRSPLDIPRMLVWSGEYTAAEMRRRIEHTIWIQGVYNDALVVGYDDEDPPSTYMLSREPISD